MEVAGTAAAPPAAPSPVASLPTDVLILIFRTLDATPHALLRVVCRVCRRWRAVAPLAVRSLTVTAPPEPDAALAAHIARFSRLTHLTLRRVEATEVMSSASDAAAEAFPVTLPASLVRLDLDAFVAISLPYPPALHTLKLYTPFVRANLDLVSGVASSLRVLKIGTTSTPSSKTVDFLISHTQLASRPLDLHYPRLTSLHVALDTTQSWPGVVLMLAHHASHLTKLNIANKSIGKDVPHLPALRTLTAPVLSDRFATHCPSLTSLRLCESDYYHASRGQVERFLQRGKDTVARHITYLRSSINELQPLTVAHFEANPHILLEDTDGGDVLQAPRLPRTLYGRLVDVSMQANAAVWTLLPLFRAAKRLTLWVAAALPADAAPIQLPHLRDLTIFSRDVDLAPIMAHLLRGAPRLASVEVDCIRTTSLGPVVAMLQQASVAHVKVFTNGGRGGVREEDWLWTRVEVNDAVVLL